jgi:hypothetical protein
MARLIYLDTHVVAWLHGLGPASLSPHAAEVIEAAEALRCSPMARLELQYLFEVGRTSAPAVEVLDALNASLGLGVVRRPVPRRRARGGSVHVDTRSFRSPHCSAGVPL